MNKNKLKFKNGLKKKIIKIDENNIEYIKSICSKSNIDFHELYYINANRYITCLELFDFMENSYRRFLNSIISYENVLVTCDIANMEKEEYEGTLEKIINKHEDKKDTTKKIVTFKRAVKDVNEILSFDNHIESTQEAVKFLTVRVYVYDKSYEALQDRLDDVINKLSSIKLKGYIQTNDLVGDVRALTKFDHNVKKMVSTSTIADFLMRSEVNKIDEKVGLIGFTVNGLYAPNIFCFENYSYNKIFLGGMGSGKSALLKLMNETMYLRKNHICHIFDIHNEYKDYAERLGIPIISINSSKYINLMQIFFVDNVDNSGTIGEHDIQNKISSVVATFRSMNEVERAQTIAQLQILLGSLYEKYLGKNIHELSNGDWFLLEDVLDLLKENLKNGNYRDVEQEDIYNIELGLKVMIENYGYLFNRLTNLEFDLTKSIVFDISFLQNDDNATVQSSYVSLLLDYVSHGIYLNKKRNEESWKKQGIKPYEANEPLYTHELIIDETMKYAKDRAFLEKVLTLVKFQRKAYSGLSLVIHATDDTEKDLKNHGDLLGQLFELCTNKFIGKTNGKSLNTLPNLVKQINENDVIIISTFEKGDNDERSFFVCDDGGRKIIMTSIVSNFQRAYFGGGV
ncbi:MAG: DUF87 domain-containing protein [Erysipelotrichaceae bacterium]